MSDNVLEVEELRASYGGVPVLHGASLSLPRGKVCGLIGPNGHGKSTLLSVLSGLMTPDTGQVRFEGSEITRQKPHQIVDGGLIHVPQGDLLFPEMTVLDNLLVGATRADAKGHAEETLEFVFGLLPRLKERQQQVAFTLSGGERRMLGIGRGLMARGTLMLLDEPSLGLAPAVIDEIYRVIRDLVARTGQTILLVEENAMRAAEVSDKVMLMEHGAIVWQGDPDEMTSGDALDKVYFGG